MTPAAHWRRWRRALLLTALFAAGLAAVALLLPACRVLGTARQRAIRDHVNRRWCRTAACILGLRVIRQGEPTDTGILAANHISWLDVIVLGMQQPLTFVAKSEVAAWPVVGYLAGQAGALFVQRGNATANRLLTEQMAWRLRRQETLVLFPEGTTSRGDQVLRFHPRLFQPAIAAKAQTQPVAIAYWGTSADKVPFVGDDEFLDHLWALLAEREIPAAVYYGTPLPPSLTRDELARQSRWQVAEQLGIGEEYLPPMQQSA